MVETAITTLKSNVGKYGANLKINAADVKFERNRPIVVDVETDEKDGFVGIGIMQLGSDIVYYYSDRSMLQHLCLEDFSLVAHNAKFDIRVLQKWGVKVTSKNIFMDTMIMSYVYNTTAKSHALKEIAKQYLGMEWDTYSDMVSYHTDEFQQYKAKLEVLLEEYTEGKATLQAVKKQLKLSGLEYDPNLFIVQEFNKFKSQKCTLNFHDVKDVANYCGCDVLATSRLVGFFLQKMTPAQRRILHTIEMPVYRILFDMENEGITIDEGKLDKLIETYGYELENHLIVLKSISQRTDILFSSNDQVAEYLIGKGFKLPLTKTSKPSVKKDVLMQFEGDEFIDALLEYRRDSKIYNTFLMGLKKQSTLPKIHTTFNQVIHDDNKEEYGGISTNRLSSSNPNLQNIPKRGEGAKLIRGLFIPDPGHTMIVGDYSQIEYRLLAHFTQELVLLEAYKNGKDLHKDIGEMFGGNRDLGKSLNFAAIYGAGPNKVSTMVGCSEENAKSFLDQYWQRLPRVTKWKTQVIEKARSRGYITTYLGRNIPIPGLKSSNLSDRYHAERCAVNYIIQGSAAEVIKLAMIECVRAGYLPRVQVHDELIFSEPSSHTINFRVQRLKDIMESVVKLDVPLIVDIRAGVDWNAAKG